jgi:hypothetical protein
MRRIAQPLALAVLAAVLIAVPAFSQTSPQDQQKATEAYMKAGAVTLDHAVLKFFAGQWDATATMWATPGAPPVTSKNTAAGELILGGRFVRLSYKGTMMGQPLEGFEIMGYDNMQKAYIVNWIDNTSTAFYLLTGSYDQAKKTFTLNGKWADPLGGTTPVKMVIRITGPDEFASETWMTMPDGKPFKSMEDRTVRRK